MKTKYWIGLILLLALVCGLLTWWSFGTQQQAQGIEVWSEGKLQYQLPLDQNATYTIETNEGTNTIQIKDGAVAVIVADCPDGYCVKRGFCSGGAQIVCLPHGLVIKFTQGQGVDAVVG